MDQQQNSHREPLKFLVFSASLRNDSLNTKLAKLAELVVEKNGAKADFAYMSEFDCPSYNQDQETKDLPHGAIEFRHQRILGWGNPYARRLDRPPLPAARRRVEDFRQAGQLAELRSVHPQSQHRPLGA